MKKLVIASLIALGCTAAWAQQGGFTGPATQNAQSTPARQQSGGFSGPTTAINTVAAAKTARDDAWVVLQGNIEQRTSNDKYTFRDATGTMTVEIDRKRWNGLTVAPQDKVQIEGKVDKDWGSDAVKIEVKTIKKVM